MGGGRTYEVPCICVELLATGGCWGRENQFSLGIWPALQQMVLYPCTYTALSRLSVQKERKQKDEVGGKWWGIGEELEGVKGADLFRKKTL